MARGNWIGETLGGRYVIEELLGQGGMSSVYKANDPNLKRVVAIKMIHPHLSGEASFLSRFEEEASAVAQLRHPNIVQVFDFNHDANVYYMVMEYIPGETLQTRLERLNAQGRKLSLDEVVRYGAEVSEAADYAHKRGLIHRDIKPANVLLSVFGQAVLMDFGIAKIAGSQRHTATGAVVGTAMYMSPEQVRGEALDARSDVYSLGVMLFEMASGQPPYKSDSAMTLMMMHLNDPVPDLRKLYPGVPNELVAIINRALAKKPADRYQSAAELAGSLRALANSLKAGAGAVDGATLVKSGRNVSNSATLMTSTPPPLAGPGVRQTPPPPAQTYYTNAQPLPPQAAVRPPTPPYGAPSIAAINPTPTPSPAKASPRLLWIGGGALLVLMAICVLAGGIYAARGFFNGRQAFVSTQAPATLAATSVLPITGGVLATPSPAVEILQPSETPAPTDTPLPTDTSVPTNTPLPTATPHPEPFVQIDTITVDKGNYIVTYETFGFTEKLPGQHIHFFFNTVTPQNAGMPGAGPWYLWGGPRPFTGYKTTNKPAAATQMCALVANADHSVQLNTGNCMDLP